MRRRRESMPVMFDELAVYNAEVARGLVHTDKWRERMELLQRHFDDWSRGRFCVDAVVPRPLPTRPDVRDPGRP